MTPAHESYLLFIAGLLFMFFDLLSFYSSLRSGRKKVSLGFLITARDPQIIWWVTRYHAPGVCVSWEYNMLSHDSWQSSDKIIREQGMTDLLPQSCRSWILWRITAREFCCCVGGPTWCAMWMRDCFGGMRIFDIADVAGNWYLLNVKIQVHGVLLERIGWCEICLRLQYCRRRSRFI